MNLLLIRNELDSKKMKILIIKMEIESEKFINEFMKITNLYHDVLNIVYDYSRILPFYELFEIEGISKEIFFEVLIKYIYLVTDFVGIETNERKYVELSNSWSCGDKKI